MNWSKWIRQFHRWVSIAFTLTVIANIVALSAGGGQPPDWITYSPLLPLAFLLLTASASTSFCHQTTAAA